MSEESRHISVLKGEVIELLQCAERPGRYLDCTFGGGGHTTSILEAHEGNTVDACDRDERALKRGESVRSVFEGRLTLHHAAFSDLSDQFSGQKFDGILADLGVSTDQLFEERGFSFHDEHSLDMRMDESAGPTAKEILNTVEHGALVRILKRGGVTKEAAVLAKAIIAARPVESAKRLSEVCSPVMRRFNPGKSAHPATVVMQALRMEVNQEIAQIESLLEFCSGACSEGGRLAIIAFHSLEDKFVTKALRRWQGTRPPANWSGGSEGEPSLGKLLTSKAVKPSEAECESNPSARSALLRVFEFAKQQEVTP